MSIVVDVVGVFDSGFNQLFPDARAIKASIKEDAKTMEHPIEDGEVITDYRIINPVEINLSLILRPETVEDTYKLIKSYFLGEELLTVQTKVDVYSNMVVQAMPHEEDSALQNTITLAFSVKEAIIVEAQFGQLPPTSVAKKGDSSTVDRGQQEPVEATPAESQSAFFEWTH